MSKVKVRYRVEFEANIEVPANATPREIGDELANISIPEDDVSKYVPDTFDPVTDKDGNPKVHHA